MGRSLVSLVDAARDLAHGLRWDVLAAQLRRQARAERDGPPGDARDVRHHALLRQLRHKAAAALTTLAKALPCVVARVLCDELEELVDLVRLLRVEQILLLVALLLDQGRLHSAARGSRPMAEAAARCCCSCSSLQLLLQLQLLLVLVLMQAV